MRKFARLFTSLSLGAAAIAVPAIAQETPAAAPTASAAPASAGLTAGAKVFDSTGAELGTVTSIDGANVVVDLGEGKQVTLPANSFGMLEKGPTIGATKAVVVAAVDQATAGADAKLAAALVPGTDVKSAKGATVVGKVKLAEADGVVLTTPTGDVKLPRNAFFVGAHGLATSFTAEQFAAAVAQASPASAAQTEATAPADAVAEEAAE